MRIKKVIITLLFLFSTIFVMGQGFTYSFEDPCTLKTKEIFINNPNGNVALIYNGNIRSFTSDELQSGELQLWISQINSLNPAGPCSGVGLSLNTSLNSIIAQNTISVLTSVLTAMSDIYEDTAESVSGLSTIEGIIEVDEKTSNKEEDKKKKPIANNSGDSGSNTSNGNSTPISGDNPKNQENGTTNNTNGTQTTGGGNEGQNDIQTNKNGTQQAGGNNTEQGDTVGNSNNSTSTGEQEAQSSVTTPINNQNGGQITDSKNNNSITTNGNQSGNNTTNKPIETNSNSESTSNNKTDSVLTNNTSTSGNQTEGKTSDSSVNSGISSNASNPTTKDTNNTTTSNTNNSTTSNTNNSTNDGNNQNSQNEGQNNQNSPVVSENHNSQEQTNVSNTQNGGITNNQDQSQGQSISDGNTSNNGATSQSSNGVDTSTNGGGNDKLKDVMNMSATMSSQVKNKVSSVKKGSLIMNGDIVAIQNTSDNSQFRFNGGIISSNTKNTFSKGVLFNFTSAINNSCLTLFAAYKHKKLTTIVANSSMLNFDKDFFNTTSLMESYKIKKYTITIGINLTSGNLGKSKFQSLSSLGGLIGTYKLNKKISNTTMMVAVYSPYVYYYEGIWYESGFLMVPFTSFDYKITKKFKMNLSFSGVHQINDKTLNYQVLIGAKTFL